MDIQWFSKSMKGTVSIYETNITLNTVASRFFDNAYSTQIGIDVNNDLLIIKAISKSDVDEGSIDEKDLHPISIKPSYGRITGKEIISNLVKFHPMNFVDQKQHKFYCDWDETKKYLLVYLNREVQS